MKIRIVLDNIKKPYNMSAVLRVAVAVGARVYLTGDSIPWDHKKVLSRVQTWARSSQYNFSEFCFIYEDLESLVEHLQLQNVELIGTSCDSGVPYYKTNFVKETAIVFGNEESGLTKKKLNLMDSIITIPTKNGINSLNLSVAVGVISFEIVTQYSVFS